MMLMLAPMDEGDIALFYRDLSRPLSRPTGHSNFISARTRVNARAAAAFNAYDYITGTPSRADDFDGLGQGAPVHGRTIPGGTGTWVADAGWVSAGGAEVRSTTNGQAAKGNLAHGDCSVRVVWNPGAEGNNQVSVFARDTQSNAFPRYGFLLSTYPAHTAAPPAQAIALYRNDNYNFVNLTGFVEAAILRGWNALELRCVGSTISGWLNGVKVVEVTDTAYATGRSRWGFAHTNRSNDGARVSYVDFTVL